MMDLKDSLCKKFIFKKFFYKIFCCSFSKQIEKFCFFPDAPQVSLRLGRTLDPENIRTGNTQTKHPNLQVYAYPKCYIFSLGHDVYFECDIKSNPEPTRLEWLLNVRFNASSNLQKNIFFFDLV